MVRVRSSRGSPRHRSLISNNKVHTGYDDPELRLRMDWNSLLSDDPELLFTRYSPRYFPPADDLVRYLSDFASRTGVRVRYDTAVEKVSRDDEGGFTVTGHTGEVWRARHLVVATGVPVPNLPAIPGVELAERYDMIDTDPQAFTDQRVLIIGRGNSAFETAENLMETAAVIHLVGSGSLKMAWRTHYVGHLRAVYNNFLDSYQLKSQNALLDGRVLAIRREQDGFHVPVAFERVDEVVREIRYDRVIVATGFRFDTSVFDDTCVPDLVVDGRFPALTPLGESVNVPDLYFAGGTLMQGRSFGKATTGFIHGFRYAVRALHRGLRQSHAGVPWPTTALGDSTERAVDTVIRRINRSSACGSSSPSSATSSCSPPDGTFRYAEEVPVDHVPGGRTRRRLRRGGRVRGDHPGVRGGGPRPGRPLRRHRGPQVPAGRVGPGRPLPASGRPLVPGRRVRGRPPPHREPGERVGQRGGPPRPPGRFLTARRSPAAPVAP